MNDHQNKWEIVFLIPNLRIESTFENDKMAIIPYNDPRVKEICFSNKWAKNLVENFEDQFNRKKYPSQFLIRKNSPQKYEKIDTIVGFRNIFAISCIIKGYEKKLNHPFMPHTIYSDYFDFYPISISKENDGYITNSPSVLGIDDDFENFRGQTYPGLDSSHAVAEPDEQILFLLEKAWRKRFVNSRLRDWHTTALFRSLEMAYQAATMPFKNHSTIYEYGASVGLWVSAFEILAHPESGDVNFNMVINLLGKYDWIDKRMKTKRYKIYKNSKSRVNLVQKLYKELHITRNEFLHGNPVKMSRLFPFQNRKNQPVTFFAPLIYKIALLCFLNQVVPAEKIDPLKEYISKKINESPLAKAILRANRGGSNG